ncbi:hypothetical protein [Jatrophihabitans lederbergiae]|uniref:Uncharacterized protein n=1 Tax=Jatrophihabitans lederbergiae TaxID=3075547 RepID=A0ABU2JAW7_9ACTN|nr:hypothetical protein [Jatrophihabitans sp. DSM 44399]MDT0262137.1 hypothetical protein [Jatrophihabitans sp. DSM 44399]
MTVTIEEQDATEAPTAITGTPAESDQPATDPQRVEAGHKVLEMFAAVCGAPDDAAVATQANQALAELQALLDAS